MVHQLGWEINIDDFTKGLEKYEDLLYYDGPLLTHYVNLSINKHYLFHWVDNDSTHNRWLVIEVSVSHLFDYLSDKRTLYDISKQEYNSKFLIVDTNGIGACTKAAVVEAPLLLPEYQIDSDSFFEAVEGFVMPTKYQLLFAGAIDTVMDIEYLEQMRAESVRFKLEPLKNIFGHTLGANDISSFVQQLTRSFRSYLEVRFLELFHSKFTEEEEKEALNKILRIVGNPRAVFANYGSFEIDLAIDVQPIEGMDQDITEWQRQVLQEYKQQIFDYDFVDSQDIPNVLGNATDVQIRSIYKPLLSIANNKTYSVKTKLNVVEDYKTLEPVSKLESIKILPPKEKVSVDNIINTELTSVLLELEKGQDPRKLTQKQLRGAVVNVSTADTSITPLNEFRYQATSIQLQKPIEIIITKKDDFYEARYEALNIIYTGSTAKSVLEVAELELARLYSILLRRIDNPEEIFQDKMTQILNHFEQYLGEKPAL